MANKKRTLICRECGNAAEVIQGVGGYRRYCSAECAAAAKATQIREFGKRRTANHIPGVNSKIRTCRQCGINFSRTEKGQPIAYCSPSCRRLSYLTKHRLPPEERKPIRQRNPLSYFNCPNCGKECYRKVWKGRLGYDDPRSSMWNRYCSPECRQSYKSAIVSQNIAARAERKALKKLLDIEIGALRRIARRPNKNRRTCRKCGGLFLQPKRIGRCCQACAESTLRALKLRAKAVRRSRLKIASEKIDPIKVFELAHWRCQMCGIWTPQELRGSYSDNAPELDHIVALACGGLHVWSNVQCLCRKCNINKGAGVVLKAAA